MLGLCSEGWELFRQEDYPGARKKFQKAVETGSKYKYLAEWGLCRAEAWENDDFWAKVRLAAEESSGIAPSAPPGGASAWLGDVLKDLPGRWEARLIAGISALFAILCGWVALERKWLWQGVKYARGRGVPKNPALAVKYFHRAARLGNALAHLKLAKCYENGLGVAKDAAKAAKYRNNVKASPDDTSCSPLLRKRREAAQAGDAQAQFELGECYYFGRHVVESSVSAVFWYTKAAEQGLPAAQFMLGVLNERGEGVKKNEAKAAKWFRKAADQGHAAAQAALGNCYRVSRRHRCGKGRE